MKFEKIIKKIKKKCLLFIIKKFFMIFLFYKYKYYNLIYIKNNL